MRIDRFDLLAYGPFTEQSLDLSRGHFGLHLIYGDNEAGKSTSLRALIGWLFGIPARTSDSFLHANAQLRIGGQLRLMDGSTLEFTRKKGNKDTLLKFGTVDPLDEGALLPFISASMDEQLFTTLWGIDHDRLIAGGRELLDQSGDLSQALFSAAVGTSNLRGILTEMQQQADGLFKPRGSKAPLNQALADYKEAQKRLKEASFSVSEWKKLQKDRSETVAAIELIENEIEGKEKVKSRLERINRLKGALAERRRVLEHLTPLRSVVILPEDFMEKVKTAQGNLQAAAETMERLQAKLVRLKDEAACLTVRTDLLENEESILALHKELGAVEKTLLDRPQQDGKRRLLRNEAEGLLKTVRPDVALDQLDSLRPLLLNKKWIAGLVQEHRLLLQNRKQTEGAIQDLLDERQSLLRDGELHSESDLDLKELKAVVVEARKAGNVEQRLREAQKQAVEEREACLMEHARLGRITGPVDTLLTLSLPLAETLDQFEKENDALGEESKEATRKKNDAHEERRLAEQELRALLLQLDVPTLADLEASRKARDLDWQLIKVTYIEATDALVPELSPDVQGGDLPLRYEQKVTSADHLADRLRLEADQVVKRSELESRIASLQAREEDLDRALDAINARQQAFQGRWAAVWASLNIHAGTPREMKQWLLRAEKLIEKMQMAKRSSATQVSLAQQCADLKRALSDQLVQCGVEQADQAGSLESLISLGVHRVVEEEALREKRRQIERSLQESEIRLKRKQEELAAVGQALSLWKQEWLKAIDGLGLGEEVHPSQAMETFEHLEAFFDRFDRSEELRRRIFGMDQVQKSFDEKVFAFADRIRFKREGLAASAVAAQLHRQLSLAREARVSVAKIHTQIQELHEELENAKITSHLAKEHLSQMQSQANVETDEALVVAGEQSRNKRDLQKQLSMLEQELLRNGDGLSLEALEQESQSSETDAVEGALGIVARELKELQQARDSLRDRRQAIQTELNAKDGSAHAASAAEDAAESLASIASKAEEYLRLQAAALILEQRIENYRKANQAPVLSRAGALFAKLTLGSYAGLRDELDDKGRPIILGVRPNDQEVPVEGMSDGTRDQLYLALRLATLEQHLDKGEPMPFVVDDILIGFDDHRTRVCLEVLAELSAATQVLLFTHHKRVMELAEGLRAEAGIFMHELGRSRPGQRG
jgi:uncharacterized protein YhaN